ERVRKQASREQELAVHPRFFNELTRNVPRFGCTRIELKRGCGDNELTKFRYDVTLSAADKGGVDGHAYTLSWASDHWTLERLQTVLRVERPATVCISGIPNARISYETMLTRLLWESTQDDLATVGQLRAAARAAACDGLDPEVFWLVGSELGYDADVMWNPS